MSNPTRSLFRAVSLMTVAGLLAGCPAVEPITPEPESPTPASGVWGLHITDVEADGYCSYIAEEAVGRVIRMDVEAERGGELALSIFGLEMFGGHADGEAWADAEFSSYWGWGWGDDEPYEDLPVEANPTEIEVEGEVESEELEEDSSGSAPMEQEDEETDGEGWAPDDEYDGEYEEDHEDYCELPEPTMDPGVYVSFDSKIRSTESMHGFIVLTVSDGYSGCTFEADFEARHLGEDTRSDLGDDDLIVYTEPGASSAPSPDPAPEKAEVD